MDIPGHTESEMPVEGSGYPIADDHQTVQSPATPPPDSHTVQWTRRWIIFAFWSVIACFGLPHWLWTTSVHRSDLPFAAMNSWSEGEVRRSPAHKGQRLLTTTDLSLAIPIAYTSECATHQQGRTIRTR